MKGALFAGGLAVVGALLFVAPVLAYTSPGSPTGYVNDFAHVLKADTIQALNAQLTTFEQSTSNEISVVTIPSMGGDYIEHYAPALFAEWGIGKKNKDNGILLLLSIEERKIRIEVGYGLEGVLPDSVAANIIAKNLTPRLKAGDYDGAVTTATADIIAATRGEYQGGSSAPTDYNFFANNAEAIFIFAIVILQWFGAMLARSKSWWAGGVVGGLAGTGLWAFFGYLLFIGLATTLGLVLFGLLFDFLVSRSYSKAKALGLHVPWWAGGNIGRGGSGGGFGGFGGGRSGGGGSSGGW